MISTYLLRSLLDLGFGLLYSAVDFGSSLLDCLGWSLCSWLLCGRFLRDATGSDLCAWLGRIGSRRLLGGRLLLNNGSFLNYALLCDSALTPGLSVGGARCGRGFCCHCSVWDLSKWGGVCV
jgi:hypothetical protein